MLIIFEIYNVLKYNISMKHNYTFYFYYSKNYSGKKKDNKAIREM